MPAEVKLVSTDEVLLKLEANPQLLLVDVRTEPEWEMHHIPTARLIPMQTLLERIGELDPNREMVIVCEHGVRSRNVAQYLVSEARFANVASMEGGMSEWNGPVARGA